jgi:prepilin-type N-terminal cleavage/methylation domain-containing protein/prepilin-type processing-associated H-X9-DG protein
MKKSSLHRFQSYLPTHERKSIRRLGFTLIELLIVVAIIVILAAVLIPATKSGIRSSMATKGASNLKQLAMAEIQYAADHNGGYTPMWISGGTIWQITLGPYVGINWPRYPATPWNALRAGVPPSVFSMPDRKPASPTDIITGVASIGLNVNMKLQASWNYQVIAVPNPTQIILLGEMPYDQNSESIGSQAPTYTAYTTTNFSRGGRTNPLMAFCDGHVEAVSPTALNTPAPSGQKNLWSWILP